jgi:hypothetical protein
MDFAKGVTVLCRFSTRFRGPQLSTLVERTEPPESYGARVAFVRIYVLVPAQRTLGPSWRSVLDSAKAVGRSGTAAFASGMDRVRGVVSGSSCSPATEPSRTRAPAKTLCGSTAASVRWRGVTSCRSLGRSRTRGFLAPPGSVGRARLVRRLRVGSRRTARSSEGRRCEARIAPEGGVPGASLQRWDPLVLGHPPPLGRVCGAPLGVLPLGMAR